MIKVVVIDDEPIVIRNLVKQIEKVDKDYQVIGTAMNGEQGMTLIKNLEPDLVFVDISMPMMTGIEMIEALREVGNETPVVILSGYADFEKAQRAIQLNVYDYLVKPLNPLTLSSLLDKLKQMLIKEQFKHMEALFRTVIYHPEKMLPGDYDKSKDYHMIRLSLGPFNFYRNSVIETLDNYLNVEDVEAMIRLIIHEKASAWVIDGKHFNEFVVILKDIRKPIRVISQQLYYDLLRKLDNRTSLTLVYLPETYALSALRKGHLDLESSLYHHSIYLQNNMIETSDKETIESDGLKGLIKAVETIKNSMSLQQIKEKIRAIINELKLSNTTQADVIMVSKKILSILGFYQQRNDLDSLLNMIIVGAKTYEDYEKQLFTLLDSFEHEKRSKEETVTTTDTLKAIKHYIDVHYDERIKVQDLAEQFGYSFSYLCITFKKLMSMSPNEYIIWKRIEMAKEMLQVERDKTVKDIAVAVGYGDPYYFSRIFKSNTGLSPTEYRDN